MNNKIKIIRTILLILIIFTFGLIFNFSNQNGTTSGSISKTVTQKIIEIPKANRDLSVIEKEQLEKQTEPLVRKLAHYSIYTILGIFLFTFFYTYKLLFIHKILLSQLIGTIYAITDEFHQLFSTGRSSELRDVLIDSFGVFSGILIVLFSIWLHNKIKKTIRVR